MTGYASVSSRTSQAALVSLNGRIKALACVDIPGFSRKPQTANIKLPEIPGKWICRIQRPSTWQQFTDFANVLKAFIGTSYLSLPFAFYQSGIVLGVVGLVVIAAITDHCCQLIIRCKNAAVEMVLHSSSKYQELQTEACYEEMAKIKETIEKEMTLGDIGKIAVGPWGYRIVNIALAITQTGFCIAYFIFMGNTIAEMFPIIYKSHHVTPIKQSTFLRQNDKSTGFPSANMSIISSTVGPINTTTGTPFTHANLRNSSSMIPPLEGVTTAPLFILLVLIPLPFLVLMAYVKSIRKLGPISGIANVTLLAGFLGLLVFLLNGFHFKPKDVNLTRWATFPVFFGQLTGAYEGIGTVIPIESSMAENRPRFPLYLHLTLAIVSSILGSFGLLGYLIYGSGVPQIVTDTLGTEIPAQLVRVTLIIAVLMTYPLQLYPVIEIAESIFFTKVHSRRKSHLNEIVGGPSVSINSPQSPTNSYQSQSYPSLETSSRTSTSVNTETQVLLPNDSDELQFKTSAWKRNLLRTMLVVVTAGFAVLLKSEFAYVNALIGSLGSSVLAYILPCMFHLVLFKHTNSVGVVIKDIVFIMFGVVGGVVGVVITVQNIVKNLSSK